MSYKYYQQSTKPIASFLMDDTTPFQDYSGNGIAANTKSGTSNPTAGMPLVAGAAFSSIFSSSSVGEFTCGLFQQGMEQRSWAIAGWFLPIPKTTTSQQQLLSHVGVYDGLTITGNVLKFTTKFLTTGEAAVTYDLQIPRAAFIVCRHDFASNELWVNGQMVAQVDITNAQQNDKFDAGTTGKLYCGLTTSTQQIAVNGISFHNTLTSEDIISLYTAGINVVPQDKIAPQLNGDVYSMTREFGSTFFNQSWEETSDFLAGEIINVNVSEDEITPVLDDTDTSIAGTWKIGVPLDANGDTSIYGVAVEWSGEGMTVDVSLDGSTWTSAANGQLVSIITTGYNPTGHDMHVRVSFAGSVLDDPGYLQSIRVIGFINNTFTNLTGRAVTVSSPAVLRDDYEPILYRDDNGVSLHGGTLAIAVDTSAETKTARSLEVLIKPITGTITISVGGTKYRNGATDTTLPAGEWSLIHYVAAADITVPITIVGDCIIGQVGVYPTALTAGQVAYLFQSYTGKPVVAVNDTVASIAISEPTTPTLIYSHDWGIDGGGG